MITMQEFCAQRREREGHGGYFDTCTDVAGLRCPYDWWVEVEQSAFEGLGVAIRNN